MTRLSSVFQSLLNRETLSLVADFLSLAGFILSVFVLWNVRKLRNVYRLRARGPALIKELGKASTNLSKFLNELADFLPQVKEEMARAAVKLRALRRHTGSDQKRTIKRVLRAIDQCEITVENEEQVRLVYIEILKISEELKDYQKDLNWEV